MKEDKRVGNFDEMVRWCKANGWDEHDFEALHQRILEVDDMVSALARGSSATRSDLTGQTDEKRSRKAGKLVFFARKLPTRSV